MTELQSLLLEPGDLGVATDLYQLTMMAAYRRRELEGEAVFELFVRRLPPGRAYLVAAGLEQALSYLTTLSFPRQHVEFLRRLPVFARTNPSFFEWLSTLRFRGTVEAIPEGRVVFPNEPLLRVRASIEEAQLVETYLLATINVQSLLAAKAARVRLAAQDKQVIDFGARRAHGFQAALYAARAGWIAGLDGTSNVLAAERLGIPVLGTAAHAYILSFAHEHEAFAHYHETYPDHCTLLVDTYDTLEGCRRATAIGPDLKGVRLDSGDLAELARGCRKILDEAGLTRTKIVLSGDLNEEKIEKLLADGVPVDSFGVGTELVTSRDQPALSGVYKLVERVEHGQRRPVMKRAEGKISWPGAKQVWRRYDAAGRFLEDVVDRDSADPPAGGEPLLVRVMENGVVTAGADVLSLASARARCAADLARLPPELKKLSGFAEAKVTIGPALRALADSIGKG